MCGFSLHSLVAMVVETGEKALKSKLDYFCVQMDLISWKPLEIPKLILTENICKYTHPLVQATAFMLDVAEGAGQTRKGVPWSLLLQLAQDPRRLFLSLKLPSGLKAVNTEDDDKTPASDACLMPSDINKKKGWFFCRSNRWQVAQEGKNTSKATDISSCCSESRICRHSLSLICRHKITLNWRDRDWACSTGDRQLLCLICVARQVRLMKMVEIMEHRALKCPLVLYFFSFVFNFLFLRRLNREYLKHLKEWCIYNTSK